MSNGSPLYHSEEWLRQKYCDEEKSLGDIADLCDTSKSTINYWMDKYDIDKRRRGVRGEKGPWTEEDTLRRLYWDEGMDMREIAEELDTTHGKVAHYFEKHDIKTRTSGGYRGDVPWKNGEMLRELYNGKGWSINRIADHFDTFYTNIRNQMINAGIERRVWQPEKPPTPHLRDGYMRIQHSYNGERTSVGIHQLLAIAEGADPHKVFSGTDYHVHHRNNIPWDNRPINIELLEGKEHNRLHNVKEYEPENV